MTVSTYLPCAAVACLTGPILAISMASPDPGGIALVIAPPWTNVASIIEASNGHIVGPESTLLGPLATFENPDFVERAKANGAWFVIDSNPIAFLCGATT